MKVKKSVLIILIAIILAAIILRFWGITSESYWIDESISIKQSQGNYSTTLTSVENDIHLPLYFILLTFWIKCFGTTELASRTLSLTFGVLSIVLAYLISKELFSERIGLIASALMAFSSIMIYYSQEARPYALFVLLTLASFYYFIRYIKIRKNVDLILYGISSVLLIYTHLFAFLILLVQNIHLIYIYKCKIKKLTSWIICQLSIALTFTPWVPILLKQLTNDINMKWIPEPNCIIVFETFRDFLGNYVNLGIFVILIITIIWIKKFNKSKKDELILLTSWIIIPFIIIIAYSLLNQSLYQVRYMLFTLPAILILFAALIDKITEKHRIKYIVLGIIIVSAITSVVSQVERVDKDDWKSVTKYIKDNTRSNDTIIVNPSYHQESFSYYYDRECFNSDQTYNCNFDKHNIIAINCMTIDCDNATILKIAKKHQLKEFMNQSIWLINVKPELYDVNNTLFSYFNYSKKIITYKEIGNIKIYRFE